MTTNDPPAIDTLLSATLPDVPRQTRDLTRAGVDGLFTYEGQTDPFLPLVGAGLETEAMLYTNIAVALPRSPLHLATAAWDLQRLTQGRFALGLGSQIKPHIERRYGSIWERPIAQMREVIAATRAIFDTWQHGTPLHFEGRWTTHTLMPPTLAPPPIDVGPPPVWLAALGPKMTALAGEAADGLLIHPFTSRRHVLESNLVHLERGLTAAGRDRNELTVTVGVIVGIHDGGEEHERVEQTVRAMLGFYGSTPSYRPVLDAHGWGDLQPELRALTKAGEWDRLGSVYASDQVDTLAVIGTPAEVAVELRARFGDVADRLALSIPRLDSVDLLAETIAAIRSG